VSLHVGAEVAALRERFATRGMRADVGLFAGVSAHVDFERVGPQKRISTLRTNVRSKRLV
jgi:hypothetical protein